MISDYLNDGITCPGCGKPLGQKRITYFSQSIYQYLTGKSLSFRKNVRIQHDGVWYCQSCGCHFGHWWRCHFICGYCNQNKAERHALLINHKFYCSACLQDVILPLLEKGVKPAQIKPVPPEHKVSAPAMQQKALFKPCSDAKTIQAPDPSVCRKDAIKAVRQAIMENLSRNTFYVILADRMDDPKHYTGFRPECLFGSLNLITHKLQTECSTYPDRWGISDYQSGKHETSPQEFNQIDWKNFRVKGISYLTCQQDWEEIFNDEITQAIEQALEAKRKEEEKRKKEDQYRMQHDRQLYTVKIDKSKLVRRAQNELRDVSINAIKAQCSDRVHIEKAGAVYEVTHVQTYPIRNRDFSMKRTLSEEESIWLEQRIQEAFSCVDDETLRKLTVYMHMGITINYVERQKYEQSDDTVATKAFSDMLTDIIQLVRHGSQPSDIGMNQQ